MPKNKKTRSEDLVRTGSRKTVLEGSRGRGTSLRNPMALL